MRRRLLVAMLLVAALAVVGFGVPLAVAVERLYRDESLLLLSQQAAAAVVAVPASFSGIDVPELPRAADGVDLALYDPAGRRLAGTGPARADDAVAATLAGAGPQRRPDALVVALPVSAEERVVGAVRASTRPDSVTGRVRRTWLGMTGLAAAVLAAAGLLAAQRSRRLARPLGELRDDAALVGTRAPLPQRPPTGVEEIDAVRAALAGSAAQLDDLLERERAFSADLAHQLRTPLTSLRLRLETEQLGAGGAPLAAQVLADVLAEVDRLEQTIDDLVTLGRDAPDPPALHPLGTAVREAGERWRPRANAGGRQLEVTAEPHLPFVTANPAAIRQVLDVLLDNAMRHGSGPVRLRGFRVGEGAVVEVADGGSARLEPAAAFARRASGTGGTGIGLALARRLAEAEGMRLVLASPGPGPVFHLVLAGRSVGPTG